MLRSITRLRWRGSVFGVGSFFQQPAFNFGRAAQGEMTLADSIGDALLDLGEFQFQNLLQLLWAKRLEDDNFVQAVHEFGREFAAGGLGRGAGDFVVQAGIGESRTGREPNPSLDQIAHFGRTQV